MRDHDDLPYIVIERRSAGFGPFFWGALIGAGAALLLAPRSGEETQEEIRDRVRRVRTAAEDRVDAARSTVTRTRDRLEDQFGSVRRRIDDVREQVEHGAERAREAIDARRGDEPLGASAAGRRGTTGDRPGVDVVVTDLS